MKTKIPKTPKIPLTAPDSSSEKHGLDEATWTYRFMCDGRRYSLIKRDRARSGIWYLQATIRGQRIVRSMDTHIADAAAEKARDSFIRPARGGEMKSVVEKRLRSTAANLGTIEDTYSQICLAKVSPFTLRNNLNSFRLVVRRGLNKESLTVDAHRALPASVLTGKLVADFEDWMSRDAVRTGRDLESNKRSVAGYLRFARSLFKQTALPRYGELGVTLPDLTGFMSRRTERAAKLSRVAPDDALLKKTFDALPALQREDPPAYIAWLLAACSLRRGEIAVMKWDWLQERKGHPVIVVPKEVAKSGAARSVRVDARVAAALNKFHLEHRSTKRDPEEEAFVIPSPRLGQGGPDARLRGQAVFKRVNAWMRKCGWATNHTLHEMRALYLTWIRDNHGLDAAQSVAGHSDRRTTQQSYVGQLASDSVGQALPFDVVV